MYAASMAGANQQVRVRLQEVAVHRHLRAIRQHPVGAMRKLLDEAKNVVPSPAVEAGRMVAQLEQDLVHFECGRNRFDQYRGSYGAIRNVQVLLREAEHVIP